MLIITRAMERRKGLPLEDFIALGDRLFFWYYLEEYTSEDPRAIELSLVSRVDRLLTLPPPKKISLDQILISTIYSTTGMYLYFISLFFSFHDSGGW